MTTVVYCMASIFHLVTLSFTLLYPYLFIIYSPLYVRTTLSRYYCTRLRVSPVYTFYFYLLLILLPVVIFYYLL